MTHHKTYRVSIALVKVTIACVGEETKTLELSEGGHDRGLDLALDYLREHGRELLFYGPAPRPEFIPHSTIRTEHYIVTTLPVKPATTARDDAEPSAPPPPAESAEDLV